MMMTKKAAEMKSNVDERKNLSIGSGGHIYQKYLDGFHSFTDSTDTHIIQLPVSTILASAFSIYRRWTFLVGDFQHQKKRENTARIE